MAARHSPRTRRRKSRQSRRRGRELAPSTLTHSGQARSKLDPGAAVAAAEQFAAATGHPCSATVANGVVTVMIRYEVATSVLGLVGIRYLTVSAVASATDLDGVTTGAS